MNTQQIISSWCVFKNNTLHCNGETIHNELSDNPVDLVKQLYRSKSMNYPKFFKMDALSRLAFVCSELLLSSRKLTDLYPPEEIGVILSNKSSSLHTDSAYYQTIKDKNAFFPNPSLFVYTLPNIMNGEICIRNGIKGENYFFVNSNPNFELLVSQVNNLFEKSVIQCCITGWVEVSMLDEYQASLFLVEKNKIHQDSANFYTFDVQNTKAIHSLKLQT